MKVVSMATALKALSPAVPISPLPAAMVSMLRCQKKGFLLSDNKERRGGNLMHGTEPPEMTATTSSFLTMTDLRGFKCWGGWERGEAKRGREIHQQLQEQGPPVIALESGEQLNLFIATND